MRGHSGPVFGRRSRKVQEEAAREEERRALFVELAQRPDTVCPFLGMVDARTKYEDGAADGHRCYAFGDPAELSAEQQTKVCLQRGYGNCPRYLRGVLVIPTEELEALRRPLPPGQRPPPVPAVAAKPARRGRARALLAVLGVLVLLGAAGGGAFWYLRNQVASSAVASTLPGGTDFSAELISLSEPDAGAQTLSASAFIGEADAAPSTTLIYVFDLSASTREGEGCGRDRNHDGLTDTPLDCEIAAANALNTQAIANGTVGEVGLVGFASGAVSADLSDETGIQSLVDPAADDDADGTPNVIGAMESAFTGNRQQPVGFHEYTDVTTSTTTTAFSAGISAACELIAETANPNRLVVFLSDGANRGGEDVADVLPCATAAVFQTFAAGSGASCDQPSEFGGLDVVAELTDGSCTTVSDLAQLPDILEAVVVPQILRVQLTVDGGEPIDISQAGTPSLPEPGPSTIQIDYPIPALPEGDHELCLIVFASDAGGPGSIESCSPVGSGGGRLTSSD
jgi:hypothetical protein